jgi:alpha,alpha-trehalose phosphorylase
MALVAGFGGMRHYDDGARFAPRLPERLRRLAFNLQLRGSRLRVEIGADKATYILLDGPPLTVHHHGEPVTVSTDNPAVRAVPSARPGPTPGQPLHRAPNRPA